MPEYLLDPQICFLNHGSFGACPREVLDVQHRWREELEREPVDFLDRRFPERLHQARTRAALFVGSRPEDLVFVQNATAGVNAVLHSLDLEAGQQILTTTHRYDAVANTLRRKVEARGASLVEAQVPFPIQSPDQITQAIAEALTPHTRLLVIDQITSPTALRFPVDAIIQLARSQGVQVLVDGAHAPGQVDLNLDQMHPDWWVGNLHKWVCAPKGAALLWTAPEHHEQMRSSVTSHGMDGGYQAEFDWPGTFDPTAILASIRAMDLHDEMGGARLREAHHALVRDARAMLSDRLSLELPHPDDPALYAAMANLPFPIQDRPARDLRDQLFYEHRVEVPVVPWGGRNWFRISGFAGYNTPADYERLATAIESISRR
jgi:isopenicillin-N epimerase